MEALESLGDNPYVAHAYEMLFDREDEHIFYLVSEWVGPRSLRDFIDEIDEAPQPGSAVFERGCEFASHLLKALEFIHEREIVHRNLHPELICLTDDGQSVPLKITDFDYARVANLQSIAGEIGDIGTSGYTAPEMWTRRHYDQRVDLFSVGIVLFELFTGERLFHSIDEVLAMDAIWDERRGRVAHEGVLKLLDAFLSRDPDDRSAARDGAVALFDRILSKDS